MYFNLYLFYDCFGNKEQTIYFVLYVLVYIIIPPRFILNRTRTCATMYTTDCCLLYLIHFMYQITYNLQTCSFIDTPVLFFKSLGGNIVTGSPISDLNPVLMAAGCTLQLVSRARGKTFKFIVYKDDKTPI